MGSYFAIRDITLDKDIWDTSAGFYDAVELFMRGMEAGFARGIFFEAPVIGCQGSQFDHPENDLPPNEGISGIEATQEMDLILARIDRAGAHSDLEERVIGSRALFEDLRRSFAKAPNHRFRGYLIF